MFTGLLSGWFQYNVGEGAFMALLGFVFVVCGITLLVLLFSGLGKIVRREIQSETRRFRFPKQERRNFSRNVGCNIGGDRRILRRRKRKMRFRRKKN